MLRKRTVFTSLIVLLVAQYSICSASQASQDELDKLDVRTTILRNGVTEYYYFFKGDPEGRAVNLMLSNVCITDNTRQSNSLGAHDMETGRGAFGAMQMPNIKRLEQGRFDFEGKNSVTIHSSFQPHYVAYELTIKATEGDKAISKKGLTLGPACKVSRRINVKAGEKENIVN